MLDKNDLVEISKIVRGQTQAAVKIELKSIKQDIKKVRQDQNVIIKFFDEEYLDLRQRVERLEEKVNSLAS